MSVHEVILHLKDLMIYSMAAGLSYDIAFNMCHVTFKGIPYNHVACF